jgi:hypothetical protein
MVSTLGWAPRNKGAGFFAKGGHNKLAKNQKTKALVDFFSDPARLFAASEQGAWFDPSDASTVFTDTAGTTPASIGQAVARINDKSGNGNHATQATSGARPIWARVPAGGRRNLAAFSEPSQDSETSNRSNITYVSGFGGFQHAIQYGDNSVNRFAYVGPALAASTIYTVSVFVEMDDGLPPVVGLASTEGDFRIGIGNTTTGTVSFGVQHVAGNIYRAFRIGPSGASASANTGVTRNLGSARTFRIAGYQIELGNNPPTAYQKVVGAFDVTETGVKSVNYLFNDLSDDAINWTAPNDTYTVARAGANGVIDITAGSALNGATDVLGGAQASGYLAINRALTATEQARLSAYLAAKSGSF